MYRYNPHTTMNVNNSVEVLWPTRRRVDMDQIRRWASDDLYNDGGLCVTAGVLTDEQALSIVQFYGNVTLAQRPGLIDWRPGNKLEGVVIERAADLDPTPV